MTAGVGAALAFAMVAAGPASAATAPAQPQSFVLYSAGPGFDNVNTVIAIGPISGVGVEQIIDDRSTEDSQDFTARWVFPAGAVTVEVRGSQITTFDPTSCAGAIAGTLQWTVTGGTDAYAGAAGTGTGQFSDRFVVQRTASGCDTDQAVINVFVARMSGSAAVAGALAA